MYWNLLVLQVLLRHHFSTTTKIIIRWVVWAMKHCIVFYQGSVESQKSSKKSVGWIFTSTSFSTNEDVYYQCLWTPISCLNAIKTGSNAKMWQVSQNASGHGLMLSNGCRYKGFVNNRSSNRRTSKLHMELICYLKCRIESRFRLRCKEIVWMPCLSMAT